MPLPLPALGAVSVTGVDTALFELGIVPGWVRGIPWPAGPKLLEPPMRLPISNFKLPNSVLNSFNCLSLASLTLSIDLGRLSFIVLISASMRRESSSRLMLAAFNSATIVSMSVMVLSSLCVLASSASFNAAVSDDSVSSSAKALLNCSSIAALSCSSCGGVGGAINGLTYRCARTYSP